MKRNKFKIVTSTILFSAATLIIHLTNRIIAASSSLKEILYSENKNYYKWRFGNVYYTKRGTGSPILLIHDSFPGSSGYEWSRIEKDLSKNHTVYNIDLLGFGRSDKPGVTYTNFVFVQLINDFIRQIIQDKTDVIVSGFSTSYIIMACRQEKELYNRIVLINPSNVKSINQMPSKKDKLLKTILEIPVFGTLIYFMIVSQENIRNQFIEKLYFNPFHLDQDIIDSFYESAHKGGYYSKNIYASYIGKFMNINIESALKTIDNSIYIVEGSEEVNGLSIIESYKKLNSAIESISIEKSKHFPQIEKPAEFLEQIKIFLQ